MYATGSDAYTCDYCEREFPYISDAEQYGPINECEICGAHFCNSCFIARFGDEGYKEMCQGDKNRCPDCFQLDLKRNNPVVQMFLHGLRRSVALKQTEQVLIDNGVEADEAKIVMQAVGYTLLDTELYPEE